MREKGAEVSKYDVEYMQKYYDLLVAEAALKDAQNAKSAVRLRRDSEGNFGYVYTADQNNVANAQQKYDDALYAMQKFSKETLSSLSDLLIQIDKEAEEKRNEIAKDSTLTDEERVKKLQEVEAWLVERTSFITGELEKMTQRGSEMNSLYAADMASSYKDTIWGTVEPTLNNWKELEEKVHQNIKESGDQLVKAIQDHAQNEKEAFDAAGTDAEHMNETISGALDEIAKKSGEIADDTETMADDMETAMGKAIAAVEDFQRTYSSQMQQIRNANQKTIESVNELIEKYQGMINKANEAAKVDLSASGKATVSGSGSGGDKTSGNTTSTKSNETAPSLTVRGAAKGSAGTYRKLSNGIIQILTLFLHLILVQAQPQQ